MDLATIIGVVMALVIVFVVQILEGGHASSILLWPSMVLVFGGAFAAGMLTRRWRTPGWLARIGVISYSLYLVHYVLLQAVGPSINGPIGAAAFLVALFGICELTYRYVEVPGQRWGRAPVPITGPAGSPEAAHSASRGNAPHRTSS